MLKIYVCRGLPASGKSTWAKELVKKNPNTTKRINKDDLRAMLDDSFWSADNEKFILQVRDDLIVKALEKGKNVIVDDTNLHSKHETRVKQLADDFFKKNNVKVDVEIVSFTHVCLEECLKRDALRPNPVGVKVIKDMYNQFLKKENSFPVIPFDSALPNAVMCDLDGTLSLLNGRSPYDASSCENDPLNTPVAKVLKWAQENKTSILLVSGREDKYEAPTLSFLHKNLINFDMLKMRKTGDNRKDCIVKGEIYEEFIKGKYNVLFVMDDRNQVVDFWRSIGLTVFQVAPGDF